LAKLKQSLTSRSKKLRFMSMGDVIDRDHAEPARGYDVLMEGRFMA
jgi:hypothetical protein